MHAPVSAAALLALLVAAPGIVEAGFARAPAPTSGEPWPAPQTMQRYPEPLRVDGDQLSIVSTGQYECEDLKRAAERYEAVITQFIRRSRATAPGRECLDDDDEQPQRQQLQYIEVQLNSSCSDGQYPEFGMDESYQLYVNSPGATGRAILLADTIWGVYRGLETMAQLVHFEYRTACMWVRSAYVGDFPRFGHRGLHLDTARHYLSVDVIQQNIDLMAAHKYNVFHWHIVDDQAFPFNSSALPRLVQGAYRPDLTYSLKQVLGIIEYARQRGVRVIPEFDTPGHTTSWGVGEPGLLTACYRCSYGDSSISSVATYPWYEPTQQPVTAATTGAARRECFADGTFGPIDPSQETTYAKLTALLDEVTRLFPDRYVHLGGDEVQLHGGYDCWRDNPAVGDWMSRLNLTTPQQVEDAYMRRLLALVEALPARPEYVVWQDVFDHGVQLRPNTIVQVWKGAWPWELYRVTRAGHRAILSSCWYLDHVSYGVDWEKYYRCEPQDMAGSTSEEQRALVIGGEACMWGEYVDDSNVVPATWPRAAAPAERLWSAKNVTSVADAAPRLEEQRCRLVYRGFAVEHSNGPGFC